MGIQFKLLLTRELSTILLNYKFRVVVFGSLLLTVIAYSFSVSGVYAEEVYIYEFKDLREAGFNTEALKELSVSLEKADIFFRNQDDNFVVSTEIDHFFGSDTEPGYYIDALSAIRRSGPCAFINGSLFFAAEDPNVLRIKTRMMKVVEDSSGMNFIILILIPTLFGIGYSERTNSAVLFSGIQRSKYLLVKVTVFYFLFTALSLLCLLIGCTAFCGRFWVVSSEWIITAGIIRLTTDIGRGSLYIPIAIAMKNEVRGAVASVIISVILFSNRAIIQLDPYRYILPKVWNLMWYGNVSSIDIGILAGITIAIVIISGVVSVVIFQRQEFR